VQATLGKLLLRLGRERVSSLLGQRSRGSPRNRAKNGNMHRRFTFFSRNCFNEYFEEFE
jgi:hypothetical protein